ncbi:MAG: Hsp20/alpha crystallin family protein [Candidatus Cloacimonetes bacterium]|nr:Hsp20/alpha crystallin family protein [Candidatus Cloacimonadota bacterium]
MYLPIRRNRGYYPTVNNVWRVFDRMMDDFVDESEMRSINSDIAENEKEYMITAELPGMEKKDVIIRVEKNNLIIEAKQEEEKEEKEKNWIRRERFQGSYRRSFVLDDTCDVEKISAEMEKGILKIAIPKAAPSVARQIEVK